MAKPYVMDPKDVKLRAYRSRGKGGQHKNVTMSAIEATHVPTGIKANASMRSQHQSKKAALKVLAARVAAHFEEPTERYRAESRRVRTYHEPDNRVTVHDSGEQFSYRQTVGKGDIAPLIEATTRAGIAKSAGALAALEGRGDG